MSKLSMCMFFTISMGMAVTYIVLNETGKLEKIKADCYSKIMDMKDNLKSKID